VFPKLEIAVTVMNRGTVAVSPALFWYATRHVPCAGLPTCEFVDGVVTMRFLATGYGYTAGYRARMWGLCWGTQT
jgi:hypothetical protein